MAPALLTTSSFCASPRKAQESQKEMKLLLDMYKSAPKEQRDKVQLMAAERKAKAEVRSGRACRTYREVTQGVLSKAEPYISRKL